MEKILDLIYKGSTSLELRDLTTTFQEMRVIIQHLQLSLILPDMEPVVIPADQVQEVVGTPAIAAEIQDSSIPIQEVQLVDLDDVVPVEDGDNPDQDEAVKMDFLKSGDEEEMLKPHVPYKCEICDKGFVVSIALKKHMKKHLRKGNQTFVQCVSLDKSNFLIVVFFKLELILATAPAASKMLLTSKVVKSNSKIIILLPQSKSLIAIFR